MKKIIRIGLAMIALAVGLTSMSLTVASDDHDKAKRLKEMGEVVPLETILEKARVEFPGRIIETELERKRVGYIYEIKIVGQSGEVRELKYNAKDATLISSEVEDD